MKLKLDQIYKFYFKASSATYAGGGNFEKKPERAGFNELIYQEKDLFYRDSFTGFYRSRGMEVIRYKNLPIFATLYGGGMINSQEKLTKDTFAFLKQAMLQKDQSFHSFRGPNQFSVKNWHYHYKQTGTVDEFQGKEAIRYQNKLVFFHKITGGIIKN